MMMIMMMIIIIIIIIIICGPRSWSTKNYSIVRLVACTIAVCR